ncbi:MAG TPA: PaaI family thioesterase, partial [Thermoleophilaceae bacterium]
MPGDGAAVEPAAEPFALSAPYDPPQLDASLLAMSGLEQLRASIRGETRPAPISELLGMRPIEADEGSAAFAMPASGWLAGEGGRPQAGVLAPLADAAHAAAVVSTLPPGHALTTLCLTLSYVEALTGEAEEVVCRARCDRGGVGELPSHSSAEVTDDRGTVLARSTARCAVFPLPGANAAGAAAAGAAASGGTAAGGAAAGGTAAGGTAAGGAAAGGAAGDRTGAPAPRGTAAVPAPGLDASGDPPIRELT